MNLDNVQKYMHVRLGKKCTNQSGYVILFYSARKVSSFYIVNFYGQILFKVPVIKYGCYFGKLKLYNVWSLCRLEYPKQLRCLTTRQPNFSTCRIVHNFKFVIGIRLSKKEIL